MYLAIILLSDYEGNIGYHKNVTALFVLPEVDETTSPYEYVLESDIEPKSSTFVVSRN